jgi:hypothetical protein
MQSRNRLFGKASARGQIIAPWDGHFFFRDYLRKNYTQKPHPGKGKSRVSLS